MSAAGGVGLPFTAGQALQQGQVPTGSTVVADIANFQFVIKNRWPDGSAKFAIMSGSTDLAANTWKSIGLSVSASAAVSAAAVSTANLAATGVTASVQYGSYGTAAWNAGDWGAPVQTWVSGPEMSAFTYRKPLGSDAHLVAWLEVRAYKGGRVEVMPWIENGYLRVAGSTAKSGTATFTLGGTQRFSQSLNLLNHQRAVLASGSTLTHWYGGDPQVTPRHNTAYLIGTKMVPNYRGVTPAGSALFNQLASSYTPLGQADYETDMSGTGYAAGIGLLPLWDASYFSSGGDPRSLKAVLINAYAAGRYGIHYRDETTNRPLAFSSYPGLVMGDGSNVNNVGSASGTGEFTPAASGANPPLYDSPHHPSMGYTAYMLTGWNYFLEELQFLATANFLKQGNSTRGGSKGIFQSQAGSNIPRGAAWGIRSLAQAADVTPDADALHTEFVNSLNENVLHYHGRYVATPNNPLGVVQPYDHLNDATAGNPWQAHIWQDDFVTMSFGYLKDQQLISAANQTKFDQFLAWKYKAIVGRMDTGLSGTFNYRRAVGYSMFFAPRNDANWDSGVGPWYANWGAAASAMGIEGADGGTSLLGSSGSDPGSMEYGYWGNIQPALSYAVDHGAAGAAAAWDRLTSASNYATNASHFNDIPIWGVMPRTR